MKLLFSFGVSKSRYRGGASRIALWLHVVNSVLAGKLPEPTIDGETMRWAIEISSFYLWQQKLIHGNNAPTRKLEGIFFKVQTQAEKYFAKSKQGLNASFLKTRINALKGWATEKIRTVVFKALAAAGHGRIEGEGSEMKYIPLTQQLVDVGGGLVISPIAETFSINGIQPRIGEVGDLATTVGFSPVITLENHSQEFPPSHQLLPEQPIHQFTNNNAETISVTGIEAVGDITNSPPIAPTPNLAVLLLQSTTWIEIANSLQKNSQKLIDVMNSFDKAQRKKIASVLIEFLCSEPQNISELSWLPIKMLNWVFKRLTFVISRIGGDSIDEACLEQVENLSFVSVEGLGSPKELWVFCEASSGKNIPVYGANAISGIALKN